MLRARMRFVVLATVSLIFTLTTIKAASIKKVITKNTFEEPVEALKLEKGTVPAIIAIEIINGTDTNSTGTGKTTSKRTIESSLGYGYQNPYSHEPPKKFVIYKYSQHDIPGTPYYHHHSAGNSNDAVPSIQKSIEYNLGTQIEHHPSPAQYNQHHNQYEQAQQQEVQYYNPGTTLYTTLTHQGQLGGLSNQVPYQQLGHNNMVPVILLRVYSNQLQSPQTALHTDLPKAHPYSSLNNINLQSLLQNYVQQYLQQQQQQYQEEVPQYQYYQPTQEYQQHAHPHHQQQHEQAHDYDHSNLPTSENYPSNQHTRVIFHSNNNGHIPVMYQTAGLSDYKTVAAPSYKHPAYVEVDTPDTHYGYSTGHNQQQYTYVYPNQVEQQVYYQEPEQSYQQHHDAQLSTQAPPSYNYHAREADEVSVKQRRSKKTGGQVVAITPRSKTGKA